MIRTAIRCFVAMLVLGDAAHAAVVISSTKTRNMNCSAGVCSPTAANAVLNTADLAAMLAGSDVKVTTGAGAIGIGITSPLTWGSSNRLTLDAQHNVAIHSTVVVEGTGGLAITLEDGAAGALNFYPGASVTFWDTTSSLVINGNAYTLFNDIATLAADIHSNPSGFYALAKDYDASADGAYVSAVIPTAFKGTFEGLGHGLANLKFGLAVGPVGLFAENDGTVKDIALTSASLVHGNCYAGLLVAANMGTIRNASATGSIYCLQGQAAGGLVEQNYSSGIIESSWAAVSVIAKQVITASEGGLVGVNSGSILRSYATGSVEGTGHSSAGGLVGTNNGTIDSSQASGNVPLSRWGGGLAGASGGTIRNSHATGNVSNASTAAGGLVGDISAVSGLVDGCYATGSVEATHWAGGLVGYSNGAVLNSYAKGSVNGIIIGGLVEDSPQGTTVLGSYAVGSLGSGNFRWRSDRRKLSLLQLLVRLLGHRHNRSNQGLRWRLLHRRDGLDHGAIPIGTARRPRSEPLGQNASINGGYPYLLADPPQ